jgi:hypothetical protein
MNKDPRKGAILFDGLPDMSKYKLVLKTQRTDLSEYSFEEIKNEFLKRNSEMAVEEMKEFESKRAIEKHNIKTAMAMKQCANKIAAQLPLPVIPAALESNQGARPKGMPSLEMIKTETARMGLQDSDAEFIFNAWMANGFRTKTGQIKSWQHALRNYASNGWLPSLRRVNKFTARDREAEELTRVRQAKQEQEQYDRENGKGSWSTLS